MTTNTGGAVGVSQHLPGPQRSWATSGLPRKTFQKRVTLPVSQTRPQRVQENRVLQRGTQSGPVSLQAQGSFPAPPPGLRRRSSWGGGAEARGEERTDPLRVTRLLVAEPSVLGGKEDDLERMERERGKGRETRCVFAWVQLRGKKNSRARRPWPWQGHEQQW